MSIKVSQSSTDSKISFEIGKRAAARKAVDDFVQDSMIIGVGSGSTIEYAVERLRERVAEEKLSVVCVPTSFQAEQLVTNARLPLGNLSSHPVLDVAIDGADEVDPDMNLIKGGGGCALREKMVDGAAKLFVVIADERKHSSCLGTKWLKGVPIEVIPFGYVPVMHRLKKMGAEPHLRMAKMKAGPVVTDEGNFIIDAVFGRIENPAKLHQQLVLIPGIVDTGLFIGMAQHALFGKADGSVFEQTLKESGGTDV